MLFPPLSISSSWVGVLDVVRGGNHPVRTILIMLGGTTFSCPCVSRSCPHMDGCFPHTNWVAHPPSRLTLPRQTGHSSCPWFCLLYMIIESPPNIIFSSFGCLFGGFSGRIGIPPSFLLLPRMLCLVAGYHLHISHHCCHSLFEVPIIFPVCPLSIWCTICLSRWLLLSPSV